MTVWRSSMWIAARSQDSTRSRAARAWAWVGSRCGAGSCGGGRGWVGRRRRPRCRGGGGSVAAVGAELGAVGVAAAAAAVDAASVRVPAHDGGPFACLVGPRVVSRVDERAPGCDHIATTPRIGAGQGRSLVAMSTDQHSHWEYIAIAPRPIAAGWGSSRRPESTVASTRCANSVWPGLVARTRPGRCGRMDLPRPVRSVHRSFAVG